MSKITVLTDAELDAVTGGILNGGDGGAGGVSANGAVIGGGTGSITSGGIWNNQSVNGSVAIADGGRGGDVNILSYLAGRRR